MDSGERGRVRSIIRPIKTVQDLVKTLNNKGQTDSVLLDFSKAFDKVCHRKLLSKLKHYG